MHRLEAAALLVDFLFSGGRLLEYLHVLRRQLEVLQTLLQVGEALQQALVLVARYLDLRLQLVQLIARRRLLFDILGTLIGLAVASLKELDRVVEVA